MPKTRFTDAVVKRLRAPEGERIDWFDTMQPGFGLRVAGKTERAPAGRKTWFVFYRIKGSPKQHRVSLGTWHDDGGGVGLADAREAARAMLRLAVKGDDPVAVKEAEAAEQENMRIEPVAERFLEWLKKQGCSERHVKYTRAILNRHVLPRWEGRPLDSITRRDVIALLDTVAAGTLPSGSKRIAGGPVAANRTLAAVRKMFNWACSQALLDASPAASVKAPSAENERHRYLSDDEIRELWPRFKALGQPFGPFFVALLLTGQRRDEVARMRWADLDLGERKWTIPESATKSKRRHVVPLSEPMIGLLKDIRRPGGPHVFTGNGKTAISGYSAAKRRLDKAVMKAREEAARRAGADAEPMPPWIIHDLRRTVASGLPRLGISSFVVGRVLNHSARTVTDKHYNHYDYLTEKRQALDAWAAFIERVTALAAAEPGARAA